MKAFLTNPCTYRKDTYSAKIVPMAKFLLKKKYNMDSPWNNRWSSVYFVRAIGQGVIRQGRGDPNEVEILESLPPSFSFHTETPDNLSFINIVLWLPANDPFIDHGDIACDFSDTRHMPFLRASSMSVCFLAHAFGSRPKLLIEGYRDVWALSRFLKKFTLANASGGLSPRIADLLKCNTESFSPFYSQLYLMRGIQIHCLLYTSDAADE